MGLIIQNSNESKSDSNTKEVRANLKFGTTSATSGPFAYFVFVANSIKESTNGNINVDVVETGASVDNIRLMKRGGCSFWSCYR